MNHTKRFLITAIFFFIVFVIMGSSYASDKLEGIENFPESYRPYLMELKKQHPNWNFTALYTNLDWKYVIDNQNIFGKNLVPKSYSDAWKNTKPGEYNVEVDSGWVDCSRSAIEYTMDPRNFLNEVRLFQFEKLSYDENITNLDGIEKILYGTEFYNRIVDYRDSYGNLITTDKKYSDMILGGGRTSSVSSYHLASRIKQEVGPFLSHSSISGMIEGYRGIYNFYNIGATSSSEPMGAILNGLKYASGINANEETKRKYLLPWDNKEKAITGGGIFIGSGYINQGQNTVYLQKFDVNDDKPGNLFWHQYMTNVLAPWSESKSIYNGYANSGILNSGLSFVIPIYENMPNIPVESPNVSPGDYESDQTKVYADVENTLNVRSGPNTSYEVIKKINKNEVMTRIAKGRQAGERWDRVILSDGIIGYVFQSYLKEVPAEPEIQVEEIRLSLDKNRINKSETITLDVQVLPDNAVNKNVQYKSSNTSVALINDKGVITAVGSGKATLTVTAQNGITSQIEIKVYSPVTGILVDTNQISLQMGQEFQVNAIVLPEDANQKAVTFESADSRIATVDKNGLISAVGLGKTEIIVTTKENGKQANIAVAVVRKIEEDELSFEGTLKVNGNEIAGLDDKDTTVNKLLENIHTSLDIEIYNNKGDLLGGEDLVGTGSKIKVLDIDGSNLMEYNLILYGDVTGDGKINSVDLLVLQRHILEINQLEPIFLKAGNINKNGKNPSSVDCLLIQRHILELKRIEQ